MGPLKWFKAKIGSEVSDIPIVSIFSSRPWWLELVLLGLFGLYAVFFAPMHQVLLGAEGMFQGLLVIVTGLLLGPWRGALLSGVIGYFSGYLWAQFYPSSFVGSALLSGAVGMGFGWLGDLLRRAAAQSRELKKAHQALQAAEGRLKQTEKLVFMGELAASIGHEINQPLTIIHMGGELAIRALSQQNLDKVHKNLNLIVGQSERAGKIIHRMKLLAKKEGTKTYETHQLNQLLDIAVKLVAEQLRLESIEVEMNLTSEPTPVHCDSVQLEMVFTNLLLNAKDALSKAPQKRIILSTCHRDGKIVTDIADTGEGIPAELMDQIFLPFFTTKEVGKGTGLGLSISNRIIESHGGELHATSAPGKGSVFSVILPRYHAA